MNTFQFQLKKYNSTSSQSLAKMMGLEKRSTISLRQLLTGPESRTFVTSKLGRAGHVEVNYNNVYLQSDGLCCYYGSVFDHGTFAGDDFTLTLFLPFSKVLVWAKAGHVGKQTHNKWQQNSWDAFIRDHWDEIANSTLDTKAGFSLHQDFDVTATILKDVETFFKDLLVIGETLLIILDDPNTSCTLGVNNDGLLFVQGCDRRDQN